MQVLPALDCATILTVPKLSESVCPLCAVASGRVHSHYTRTLADRPWQGRRAAIQVRARRFRCATAGCPRRVFAERLPEVAQPRARRSVRLGSIQRHIGFALGGDAWLVTARSTALRGFVTGLISDIDAVRVALSQPWSNGPVEGQVNRLKLLKRQMYGRANFDILRSRVLHVA